MKHYLVTNKWRVIALALFAVVAIGSAAFALTARTSTADVESAIQYNEMVASQQAQAAKAAADTAATLAARPVVAFLGDSFTIGTGATSKERAWPKLLADSMGWQERNFGFGGTNYGTPGDLKGGTSYVERVAAIVAANPATVIVSSAGNTLGEDQREGIRETFEALRAGLPKAKIIATSPYTGSGAFDGRAAAFGDEIRSGVEAVGGTYLDIGHPLEGREDAISKDGVHPNDIGYQVIAEVVGVALSK